MDSVEIHHVRLAYSKSLDDVGRFRIGKLFHLVAVILRVMRARIVHRVDTLYYPPSGPNRVPMWRDIAFLLSTRWMFRKTIFHMQAGGLSTMYEELNPVSRLLFRLAYFRPDGMVRMSKKTPDDATGLQAESEFIVPNCADDELETYRQIRAGRAAEHNRRMEILYLGTVCETKGILDLLEACRRLQQAGTPFHLNVVGSCQPEAFRNEVQIRISALDLTDHVTLHGQLTGNDKFAMFARSDVFCMPTFYESEAFPCVILEAMSFGLPVVATNWRGIPSIVNDGATGFLVDPHDVDGLASHLGRLGDDRELRATIGAAGREKYEQKYTVEAHLDQMERMFVAVCTGSRGGDPLPAGKSCEAIPARR